MAAAAMRGWIKDCGSPHPHPTSTGDANQPLGLPVDRGTFFDRAAFGVQPLHVLRHLQQVVQGVRHIIDREVAEDLLVVGVDFRQRQHLPDMAA
jgi:hypothetical protein